MEQRVEEAKEAQWPADGKYANLYPLEFAPISAMTVTPFKALLKWFTEQSGDGMTLDSSQFEISALKPFIHYASLVNLCLKDGHVDDYQIRITSRALQEIFGMLPNTSAREAFPGEFFTRWSECFEKCRARRKPVYCRSHTLGNDQLFRKADVLLLPLTHEEEITQILVAHYFSKATIVSGFKAERV